MKYQGSKRTLIKYIKPYFDPFMGMPYYVEPFVGGANAIYQIDHPNKYGYDTHPELIAMWQAIQKGWQPPRNVSEELYEKAKCNHPDISDELRGFIGFGCSFGAKWFGGYARDKNENGNQLYATQTANLIQKRIPQIANIEFDVASYVELDIIDSLVYCDPPYKQTTDYAQFEGVPFNSNRFYEWCHTNKNHSAIFISEATCPSNFRVIWQTKRNTRQSSNNVANGQDRKTIKELLLVPSGGLTDIDYTQYFEDEVQETLKPVKEYML